MTRGLRIEEVVWDLAREDVLFQGESGRKIRGRSCEEELAGGACRDVTSSGKDKPAVRVKILRAENAAEELRS